MHLNRTDFSYILPEELIACEPYKRREESRLLVFNCDGTQTINHAHRFRDVLKFLNKGDCLVLNETKVLPIRIFGNKESGARLEFLLLDRKDSEDNKTLYTALARPAKRIKINDEINIGDKLVIKILDKGDFGEVTTELIYNGTLEEVLNEVGEVPLPHYIKGIENLREKINLKERYNTVYAKNEGSSAAPTAGLHFTNEILKQAEDKGVKIAKLTLNVGLGTFRPVSAENITDHKMHSETYEISQETADIINSTKQNGNKVICVGTTSLRSVESSSSENNGIVVAGQYETNIFIHNDYNFKITDALITNFHLPESTLLMLVCSFVGYENGMKIYKEAVEEKYKFYSFGDSSILFKQKR